MSTLASRIISAGTALLTAATSAGCGSRIRSLESSVGLKQITVDTIKTQIRPFWRIDATSRVYVNSSVIDLTGRCPADVKAIQASVAGVLMGAAVSCTNGEFAWRKTLADGQYALEISPFSDGAAQLGSPASERITFVVDTVPPPDPTIQTNQGAAIYSLNPRIEVEGETTGDAYSLETSGNCALHTANGVANFTCDATLNPGETRVLAFTAVDFAGNRSSSVTIDLSHLASVAIEDRAFVGRANGVALASAGGLTMESSNVAPILHAETTVAGTRLSSGAPATWMNSN